MALLDYRALLVAGLVASFAAMQNCWKTKALHAWRKKTPWIGRTAQAVPASTTGRQNYAGPMPRPKKSSKSQEYQKISLSSCRCVLRVAIVAENAAQR
jgi:hypothetical protein